MNREQKYTITINDQDIELKALYGTKGAIKWIFLNEVPSLTWEGHKILSDFIEDETESLLCSLEDQE